MWLIPLFLVALFVLAIMEKKKHQKNIRSIPIRINVNGIRGKSTITRLITGILIESGYRAIGKTTGTAARLIYWDKVTEKPIKRRLEGPNISEQIKVVSEAAKRGAQCLVSECMAVNPDYQITFQEEMIRANMGVIANVLEDHMDVMGPSLVEVAEALKATIPYRGQLVVSEGPYVHYFIREARRRKTKVYVADPSCVQEEYLKKFSYMLFPENVAIALTVAKVLGINEQKAVEGMLKANPDPGAMRVLQLNNDSLPAYFVNGFAANDSFSTLQIWERLTMLGYPVRKATVIMNCREDRMDRTLQFAKDVLPHIPMDTLIVIGEMVSPIVEAYSNGSIRAGKLVNLENQPTATVIRAVQEQMSDRVIYGIGNIHGAAEPVCDLFEKIHEKSKVENKHKKRLVQKRERIYG